MLAMVDQTLRGIRLPASSLTTIASMLAPTGSGRSIIPLPYRTPFSLARDHCDPTPRGRHSDS